MKKKSSIKSNLPSCEEKQSTVDLRSIVFGRNVHASVRSRKALVRSNQSIHHNRTGHFQSIVRIQCFDSLCCTRSVVARLSCRRRSIDSLHAPPSVVIQVDRHSGKPHQSDPDKKKWRTSQIKTVLSFFSPSLSFPFFSFPSLSSSLFHILCNFDCDNEMAINTFVITPNCSFVK